MTSVGLGSDPVTVLRPRIADVRVSLGQEVEPVKHDRSCKLAGERSVDSSFELVYCELRRRAAEAMRRLPPGHTIQPTALVHEVYVALATRETSPWRDEQHFLAVATRAIRFAVVDRIRSRKRLKRGGGVLPWSFCDGLDIPMPKVGDDVVLGVDELIERLREIDGRAADVVCMRFFLGMGDQEIAQALGVTPRTVRRDWAFAKTWLMRELAARGTRWSDADEV